MSRLFFILFVTCAVAQSPPMPGGKVYKSGEVLKQAQVNYYQAVYVPPAATNTTVWVMPLKDSPSLYRFAVETTNDLKTWTTDHWCESNENVQPIKGKFARLKAVHITQYKP